MYLLKSYSTKKVYFTLKYREELRHTMDVYPIADLSNPKRMNFDLFGKSSKLPSEFLMPKEDLKYLLDNKGV